MALAVLELLIAPKLPLSSALNGGPDSNRAVLFVFRIPNHQSIFTVFSCLADVDKSVFSVK